MYYLIQAILSPIAITAILSSKRIHPAYKLTIWKKLKLGFQFFINFTRVKTATSPKVHLAMALKLFEIPPEVKGVVVECGTFKGGTATNLSLACRLVGRELVIFDSFEGLPEGVPQDREAKHYSKGDWAGSLSDVQNNIKKAGAIECCTFVRGWFNETLPQFNRDVVLAYVDVDLEASLDTCIKFLWPHLSEHGFIFIDECLRPDYCALFYSERWWKTYFDRTPPGLIGAGTGIPVGDYYVGPFDEIRDHPMQHTSTGAYTSKQMSGYWAYYPDN